MTESASPLACPNSAIWSRISGRYQATQWLPSHQSQLNCGHCGRSQKTPTFVHRSTLSHPKQDHRLYETEIRSNISVDLASHAIEPGTMVSELDESAGSIRIGGAVTTVWVRVQKEKK